MCKAIAVSPQAPRKNTKRIWVVTDSAIVLPSGEGELPDHAISIANDDVITPHSAQDPTTAHARTRSGEPFRADHATPISAQVSAARARRSREEITTHSTSERCCGWRR
jgi:hypothetical protein